MGMNFASEETNFIELMAQKVESIQRTICSFIPDKWKNHSKIPSLLEFEITEMSGISSNHERSRLT